MKRKIITVENTQIIEGHSVKITFNDHTTQTINFLNWIKNNPHIQYNYLLNEESFQKEMIVENGFLYWGKNSDLEFPIIDYYRNKINN